VRALDADFGIIQAPVLALVAGLEGDVDREWIGESGTDIGFGQIGVDIPGMQTDQLVGGIADHFDETRIGLDEPMLVIEDGDAVA
jgi:hypothetical protein